MDLEYLHQRMQLLCRPEAQRQGYQTRRRLPHHAGHPSRRASQAQAPINCLLVVESQRLLLHTGTNPSPSLHPSSRILQNKIALNLRRNQMQLCAAGTSSVLFPVPTVDAGLRRYHHHFCHLLTVVTYVPTCIISTNAAVALLA